MVEVIICQLETEVDKTGMESTFLEMMGSATESDIVTGFVVRWKKRQLEVQTAATQTGGVGKTAVATGSPLFM